jgi:hypothetical protein
MKNATDIMARTFESTNNNKQFTDTPNNREQRRSLMKSGEWVSEKVAGFGTNCSLP